MGKAETKRILGNPYKGVRGAERRIPKNNGSVRNIRFSEEQMAAMRPGIDRIKRACIVEDVKSALDDATAVVDLHREAVNIVREMNGNNGQQETVDKLMGVISGAAEKAVLTADAVQQIASSQKGDIDTAYSASTEAARATGECIDAARQAFLDLQALRERQAVQDKGASAVANLVKMGVDGQIARELCRSDWDRAETAVVAAREIAAAKDEQNLTFGDVVQAIDAIFTAEKYDLERIFLERKYFYDGGVPNADSVISRIERELRISFAVVNEVNGVETLYHLRRMKLLAMVWWLFYQPDYLWRPWQKSANQQSKVLAEEVAKA
jgi:hypothetical protein